MQNKKKIKYRVISIAVSLTILANCLPLSGLPKLFNIANPITASAYTYKDESTWDDNHSYNFQSIDEFTSYCHWYATNTDFADSHKNDTISIAFSNATLPDEFPGLGHSSYPFGGTVTFADTTSLTITTNRAFFTYLSDKATIKGTGESVSDFTLIINRTQSVADGSSAPILADHVVHSDETTAAKKWKIQVTGSNTFSGAIGEIGSGAFVDLTFTNNTGQTIESKAANEAGSVPDAGLFCGSMGSNSVFTVKYISDNAISHSTSSANGNAGTFVGTVGAGATLNVISDATAISSAVTANGIGDKGFAGGLVGVMDPSAAFHLKTAAGGNAERALSTLSVGGSVTGNNGAGGLYGSYGYTVAETLNLNSYNVTATVYGKYCGGLFGVLSTTGGLTISSGVYDSEMNALTSTTSESYTSGTGTDHATDGYFGGVIGKLTTNSLADTILLQDLKITPTASASFGSFGGVIGIVDSAAYIKVKDVEVTATGMAQRQAADFFGGVIGATSAADGVFVDLDNFKLSANGFYGGGIVGKFNNGVLRLTGTTDMTGGKPGGTASSTVKNGQLVGENDNVLVYTPGGWTFKRSSGAIADDLGTWGEVVRISGIESGIITFNGTAHTATVAAAIPAMTTQSDLVKTALNMQLDSCDCLIMSGLRTTMLGTNLSLSGDLSFAGTGITGFMRDGGDLTTIGCYTGTFNGNYHIITLAVGEKYGDGVSSASDSEGIGQIYRHQYNGLFSVLGGTVSNLTLDHEGYINVRNCVDGMHIGGVAACNGGNVTLTAITANETINYHEGANVTGTEGAGKNIGGLIGFVGTNGNITINGISSIGANIKLSGKHQSWDVYGGAIGKVTAETFNITIGTANYTTNILTVGMKGDVSGVTAVGSNADCGGLIGHITDNGSSYASRVVNINNLKFDDVTVGTGTFTPTIGNAANTNAGGFLGYSWMNATVNINGLTITKGTINNFTTGGTAGGNSNVGVMCYEATGRWNVDKLTVTNMTMSNGGGTSVGMLVNKAFKGDDGLYLNVLRSGYTLTAASLPSLAKFDEIAAYSAADANAVLAGGKGAGVISINMNAARTETNSRISARTVNGNSVAGTGTYQNQLTGITCSQTSKYANPTARYYYNLDIMSNTDGGENLLLWSVNKYASPNIAPEFKSTTSHPFGTKLDKTLSGTADMTGLSFYPLAKADGYTIGALNLTLDYAVIYTSAEAVFNTTYNTTDSYIRDPGEENQHYLMHSGLFLNSTAANSLIVSGAMTLSGTFLEVGNYQGVLISDTMRGTFDSSLGSISLNGITPKTTGNQSYTNGYLLINKIRRESASVAIPTLKMYNVSTGAGYVNDDTSHETTKVAKSLIGTAEGPGLNIEFSLMKLDGRDNYSNCSETALYTAYNTYNSIFDTSTLLASIKTDQKAQLIYNYTVEDDWTNDRKVTYGKEIAMTSGCEYADKEWQYYGSDTYTNPESQNGGQYNGFSTFLPYVAIHFSAIDPNVLYYRDLKVNVVATGLTVGCGTYNDPYIISENDQLINVAAFLQNCSKASTLGRVKLPKTKPTSMTSGDRWCTDKNGSDYHVIYTAAETFTKPADAADAYAWQNSEVQQYLASAYYKVTSNVTLGDTFAGLGDGTTGAKATAFRGVIVGQTNNAGEPSVTITNNSDNPFIKFANGCVVKDIIISVGSDITCEQTNNTNSNAYFGYYTAANSGNTCAYYGGIIGEVMGGDNIIDNSYVQFGDHTVTLSGAKYNNNNNKIADTGLIVPVGGYVGVVMFGGLIFKNMDALNTTLTRTGLKVYYKDTDNTVHTDNNLAENTDAAKAAIYVNPIVGRVINGYAVNETGGNAKDALGTPVTQYSYSEDGYYHDDDKTERTDAVQHTLKNGKKHYPIADLNPNISSKLDVTATSGSEEIDVPNAQALFVLSLITQSGAGTATDAALGAYPTAAPSLSYGTYSGTIYGKSHNASYSDVGTDTALVADDPTTENVDETVDVADYSTLAKFDTADNTAGNSAAPYIVKHYTECPAKNETITETTIVSAVCSTVTSYTETTVVSYVTTSVIPKNSKIDYTGNTISDGDVFLLWNDRLDNGGAYQANNYFMGQTETGKDNRNYVFYSTDDITQATEVHFEEVPNSSNPVKYYLWFGTITNKNYLKVTQATSNSSRGNLLIDNENKDKFIVYKKNDGYWRLKSIAQNKYISMGSQGNGYWFSAYNSESDAGVKLTLCTRTLEDTTVSSTVTSVSSYVTSIISTYTTTSVATYTVQVTTPNYPARCVTKDGAYYDINLTGSGTYYLPDSFRGLGCVGNNNNLYAMKVDVFDGKGCTIDEDIYLNKFQTDNYFNVIHNVTTQATNSGKVYGVNKELTDQEHHGIGLFDSIITSGAASKITKFTLKGSVNTEIYNDTYADSNQEQTVYASNAAKFISVGGVCGSSNPTEQYLSFDQIALNSLSVCGSCVVGGLLGYSNNQSETIPVNITKCSAVNLSIKMNSSESLSSTIQARNAMGGFVGKCVEGMVVIEGDTTNRSNVTIKSFGYETLAGVTDHRTVCGGLVGFAGNGCTVKDTNVSSTTGYTVEIGSNYTGYAGGLVGLMQPAKSGGITCEAVFQNCKVEKINVNGHYAGGFYGGKWFDNNNTYVPYKITLENCQVIGDTTSNNTIKGNSLRDASGYAGGFLGCGNVFTNGSPNIEIMDCKVSHYTITSTAFTNGNKGYAGGFIGYTGSSDTDSSITCYIHDSSVENCTIGTGNNYAGGAIGQVYRRSTNSNNKILGYNIKLDTVTLGGASNGAWIGYVDAKDNTTSIQFTGLGVYGNGFAQNVGNRSNFTKASFAFADYDGACASMNESNENYSTFNASADSNVSMPKYPYVNVNPQSALGSNEVISGDGAVLLDSSASAVSGFTGTGKKTMAAKIYSEKDTSGTAKQYYTTFSDLDIGDVSDRKISYYMNRSKTDEGDRISTFATERGMTAAELAAAGVDDFAVLVIANANDTETTDLINRYIQLVTNTTNDYATESTEGYYHVDIKTCEYNGGSFSITHATNHGIENSITSDGKGIFSLNNDYADSLNGTFTLLDVQFMDPMHPIVKNAEGTVTYAGKIAYHLYVPVYTIREMAVKFYTAAKTGAYSVAYPGTNQYESLINECITEQNSTPNTYNKRKHADTLDTWVTQYIRYEYAALDINALLNAGNVNWNYKKTVDFETITNGDDKKRLPNDTYMVLVDPNGNSDKAYYATVNANNLTNYTIPDTNNGTKDCWRIPLTAFKAEDYDGNDANNTSFSIPTINDVIAKSIVSTPNNSNTGRYQKLTPTAEQLANGNFAYDVYAIENGVKTYYEFREAKNGDSDLSVNSAVYEDYYISVKVPKTAVVTPTDVYFYQIKIPSDRFQISDIDEVNGHNKSPRTAGVTQQNEFQILIADLFNQTGSMVVTPDVQQITNTNHTITAKLSTEVTPKNPTAIYYLNDDSFFHSFYITLVRTSAKGIENDIKALKATDVTATYQINSGTTAQCADVNLNLKENYLNVQTATAAQSGTLLGYLRESGLNKFTISADIVMNFDQDELPDEFPKRSSGEEYGVNVRAASNIAYESSSLANTSMTNPYPLDRHNYYIETVRSASLKYSPHAEEIDTVYDEIGYNSKNQTTFGVNGISANNADRTDMPVNTQAFYNVQLVSDSELSEAKVLKLTFKLEKKNDSEGTPVPDADYAEISALQNYIDGNITFKSKDAVVTASATGSTVTAFLNVEDCDYAGKLFKVDISFNAKSGGSFKDYANYKIDLKADLYKIAVEDQNGKITGVNNESIITTSSAEDYLIYTNAKINPQFIRITNINITGSKTTLQAHSIPIGATGIKVDGVNCVDAEVAATVISAIVDELETHTLVYAIAS